MPPDAAGRALPAVKPEYLHGARPGIFFPPSHGNFRYGGISPTCYEREVEPRFET